MAKGKQTALRIEDDKICKDDEKIFRLREKALVKKRAAGLLQYRNKKYDPEMCFKVVDMMKEGKSRLEVAVELEVTQITMDKWEREYPEFAEACHLGEEACQAWWEKKGRDNLISHGKEKFNTSLWVTFMKNKFGWTDRVDQTVEQTKRAVLEIEDKRQEIERANAIKHTAGVLEVLRGVGALQSGAAETSETKTE